MAERLRPRSDAKIGGLELERYRRAGKRIGLEARRDFFRKTPQPQLQRTEIGDVAVERGFRRDAFGLTLGADRPVVETVRETETPPALGAVAAPQLTLAGALQIADGVQAVAGQA